MANGDEIKAIELRRLAVLEQQRAYAGIDTDPKVLLEIADLRQKYGSEATAVSRDTMPAQDGRDPRNIRDLWNEVDFLRAMCSSILVRLNNDAAHRIPRQYLQDAWMLLLTIMLLYALIWR